MEWNDKWKLLHDHVSFGFSTYWFRALEAWGFGETLSEGYFQQSAHVPSHPVSQGVSGLSPPVLGRVLSLHSEVNV